MALGNPHTLGQDLAGMANNSLVILSFVSNLDTQVHHGRVELSKQVGSLGR